MREQDVAVRYRVIGVGAEGGVLGHLDALLEKSRGDLYLVSRGPSAIEMAETLGPIDLMLVEFPLAGEDLETFFAELYERVESPPRVAVLAADADGAELPDLSRWNCAVLSFDRRLDRLAAALRAMLERAPRVAARLMVRLEVVSDAERLLRLAQTENISKSGMLVRTDEEFPADASVRFELSFPEDPDPVRGSAMVVRRVDPGREKLHGVGVKFQAMLGSDQLRLERFLVRAVAGGRAVRWANDACLTAASS